MCMVDHFCMVAEAILQLNFQRKCSSWASMIKISPAAHVKRLCNGQRRLCNGEKRFVFVFFLGGPAPTDRRGGAHLTRD